MLVDCWTLGCISWLRTLAYLRAWAEKYSSHGLVVIGVHTPEFPFEADAATVEQAAAAMRLSYPIALDPDVVWHALGSQYWRAIYLVDTEGRIQFHHFGEGGFEECEQAIRKLVHDAGYDESPGDFVSIAPDGVEAKADYRVDMRAADRCSWLECCRRHPFGLRLTRQFQRVFRDLIEGSPRCGGTLAYLLPLICDHDERYRDDADSVSPEK